MTKKEEILIQNIAKTTLLMVCRLEMAVIDLIEEGETGVVADGFPKVNAAGEKLLEFCRSIGVDPDYEIEFGGTMPNEITSIEWTVDENDGFGEVTEAEENEDGVIHGTAVLLDPSKDNWWTESRLAFAEYPDEVPINTLGGRHPCGTATDIEWDGEKLVCKFTMDSDAYPDLSKGIVDGVVKNIKTIWPH